MRIIEPQAIPIASSRSLSRDCWFATGLGCLVMLPIGVNALLGGEPIGLFFLGVPLATFAMAIWADRTTSEVLYYLFPDHLISIDSKTEQREIERVDIESIHWPRHGGLDVPIRLGVYGQDPGTVDSINIKPGGVADRDRAILIAYLHLTASENKQENWPEYCVRCAVPLLDGLVAGGNDGTAAQFSTNALEDSKGTRCVRAMFWIERHPFYSGLFLPLLVIPVFVLIVSREAYWMTAAAIAFSAVVNIRLIWGQWLSPFTEVCFGFAAALFLMGCFSPPRSTRAQSKKVNVVAGGGIWILLLIVGGPLVANAAQAGIVPHWIAKELLLVAFYGTLLVPIWIANRQLKRQLMRDAEPGSVPLARWASFEREVSALDSRCDYSASSNMSRRASDAW